ncbi:MULTISPECIES: sortase [Bacillus]|uniref:sortase n=1 Tax=Bacillus TaxID=1386 RepID=UPI000BB72A82|nr:MULTISPECIES: class D sortase [Bacillus]
MNKWRILSVSLIAIGILFLCLPLYHNWSVNESQSTLRSEWNSLNRAYASDNSEEKFLTKEERSSLTPPTNPFREKIMESGLVGQLKIPSINVDVMIAPGVTNDVLKNAVGWMTSTSLPEENSNIAIAGHRSHTYGQFFHRMGEVEIGDIVYLETLSGEYKFEVYDILVVLPDDLSVLDPTDEAELTLITCEPLYSDEFRLIVKAKLYKQ